MVLLLLLLLVVVAAAVILSPVELWYIGAQEVLLAVYRLYLLRCRSFGGHGEEMVILRIGLLLLLLLEVVLLVVLVVVKAVTGCSDFSVEVILTVS